MSSNCPKTTFLKKKITQLVLLKISQGPVRDLSISGGGGGGGGRGYDSSHFGWDQTHGKFIWHYLAISKATAGEKHLRVGHRGPVGRKTTQKPPQNTKKWKKIVKKRLFSRFGHFGQNSDFSRKKSKTGIFFDITKPPLAQIYPKSGL